MKVAFSRISLRLGHALVVFACAVLFVINGCASQPPRPSLAPYVGMPGAEVEATLGAPNATFESEFGQDSATGPWSGLVWLYFGELDPRYKYVERRLKDTFVFVEYGGELRLNHWDLEAMAYAKALTEER